MSIITSREVSKGVAAMLEKTWDVRDNCHEIGVIAGKPHVRDAKVKLSDCLSRTQSGESLCANYYGLTAR